MPSLYPYQIAGADWLAKQEHVGLADEAGLGKTAQAIEAACRVNARRVAVACPAVAREVWQREFKKWWPKGRPDLRIESFDRLALHRDLRQEWYEFKPNALIIDECHFLKNRDAKRSKALYGSGCRGKRAVVCGADHVWLLSATPGPNHAGEFWTHLRALRPDLVGDISYYDFLVRYTYFQATEFGVRILGNRNAEELRAILRKVFLRRTVRQVLPDLPGWRWNPVPLDAGEAATQLLHLESNLPAVAALRECVERGDGDFWAGGLVQLSALRRVIGTVKAPLVASVLRDELEARAINKVVIFAYHHDVINAIHGILADFHPVQYTGKTPEPERAGIIDRFETDPATRVFIGQITACGTSITLTAANQVAFAESSWVPDENYQAAKRVHRIGQKLPVFVRMFGLAGSIDDAIAGVCARKAQMKDELRIEE